MLRNPFTTVAAALFATFTLAGIPGQTAGGGRADEKLSAGLQAEEFDTLCETLRLKRQPWASIPWKASVTDARRLAAEAKIRPM